MAEAGARGARGGSGLGVDARKRRPPGELVAVSAIPPHHHGAFGQDTFGRAAEKGARFFGTPGYLIGQTVIVLIWIALNGAALSFGWDPYPFILLNLAFSLQAAYAAPLILLAETRQAERDKAHAEADERHRETMAQMSLGHQQAIEQATEKLRALLEANTDLTRQDKELTEKVEALTREIHARVAGPA